MAKVIYTATDVRNNFFNLLDMVITTGNPVYIKKGREVKVKLEPVGDELDKDWAETKKLLDKTRGMWKHLTEEQISGRFNEADLASTKKIRARKW